jgi:hypothetical protein
MRRLAITKLQEFLSNVIASAIPGLVKPILQQVIAPIKTSLFAKLSKYLDATGSTVLIVRHHSVVRCPLFTLSEVNSDLGQNFDTLVTIPPTGCAASRAGGGNFSYRYSAASCELAATSIALVGVTPLDGLGPAAFYISFQSEGGQHTIGFPAKSNPGSCVLVDARRLADFDASKMVGVGQEDARTVMSKEGCDQATSSAP